MLTLGSLLKAAEQTCLDSRENQVVRRDLICTDAPAQIGANSSSPPANLGRLSQGLLSKFVIELNTICSPMEKSPTSRHILNSFKRPFHVERLRFPSIKHPRHASRRRYFDRSRCYGSGRTRAVQRYLLKVIENMDLRPPRAAA